VSSSLKNETYDYEHIYFPLSSSLKNETNPPPINSSPPLDLVPKLSFHMLVSLDPLYSSLSREPIPISIQESFRVQKKSWWMKQILGGMSPTSRRHDRVKSLAYVYHAWVKVPTYGHHVGKKTW
jgi:hypothetical protein